MTRRTKIPTTLGAVGLILLAAMEPAQSAHPLITEDTGTQGHGNFQLELNTEHLTTTGEGNRQYSVLTQAVLSYGVLDPLDVIVTIPHLRLGASAAEGTPGTSGLADASIDLKWRFYQNGPWSLAAIPGASFPTGDESEQLGTGRINWNAFVVSSYELDRWGFHVHVGHVHHNNTFNERVNVWHASTAIVYSVAKTLRWIADTGIDSNTEHGSDSNPVFVVTGIIWSPHKDFDIDLGYRWEHADQERTRVVLAGLTWRNGGGH